MAAMTTTRTAHARQIDELESWESWPLWALGISQGLNVFRWYVGDQMPRTLTQLLGWLIVLAGIAAAASLDGAMIATVMGRRGGRSSNWSAAATAGAMLFSAGIALDVHGGLGLPWLSSGLHVAQPVQMFLYLQHLSQRRNALQDDYNPASLTTIGQNAENARISTGPTQRLPQQDGFRCSRCNTIHETLNGVRYCPCRKRSQSEISDELHRPLSASMQQNEASADSDAVEV